MSEAWLGPEAGKAIKILETEDVFLQEDPALARIYADSYEVGFRFAHDRLFAAPESASEKSAVVSEYDRIYTAELQRTQDGVRYVGKLATVAERATHAEYRADHDILTGLLRREALPRVITKLQKAEQAQRGTDRKPLTVSAIMADIDYFKHVNDTYGHSAGDDVLRETARRLADNLREGDYAFRFGGEEFLLLLNGATAKDAAEVAERLRASISGSPVAAAANGAEIAVTASFGVADIDVYDLTRGTAAADLALYLAKSGGRNQVVQYGPGMYIQPGNDSD
ncbi:MAG TPA: GGDEF domain-containing protein [Candidatus Saccharimonadales bacterium]|nr:GGDEF domain-containing protein [Candidatus Saccharimonadales bacterium]